MSNDKLLLNDGTSGVWLNDGTSLLLLNTVTADPSFAWFVRWEDTPLPPPAIRRPEGSIATAILPIPTIIAFSSTWAAPIVSRAFLYQASASFVNVLASGVAATPSVFWNAPFAEPIRRRPPLEGFVSRPTEISLPLASFEANWGQPFFGQEFQYQGPAVGPGREPDVVVAPVWWQSPFTLPLFKACRPEGWATFVPQVITQQLGWQFAFSEPLRLRYPVREGSIAHAPQFIPAVGAPADNWLSAFSQPLRVRQVVEGSLASVYRAAVEVAVTPSQWWHSPFSEPIRQRQPLRGFTVSPPQAPAEPQFVAFAVQFSAPIISRNFLYQMVAAMPESPPAAVVTTPTALVTNKWVGPQFKRRFIYQSGSSLVFVPETTQIGWFVRWQEPVRRLRATEGWTTLPPRAAAAVITTPTQLAFFTRFSEPVRRKVAPQGAIVHPPQNVGGTSPQDAYSFSAPWSFPTLYREFQYQTAASFGAPGVIATVTPSNWWQTQFSEPVRRKLPVQEGSYSKPYRFEPAVGVPSFLWFSPFSEPVRTKPIQAREGGRVAHVLRSVPAVQTTPTALDFFTRWTEPPRRKAAPVAAGEISHTFRFVPAVGTPSLFWLSAFSEPIRRAIRPQGQIAFTPRAVADAVATPSNWWQTPFAEPLRRKPVIQGFVVPPAQPAAIQNQGWQQPFATPAVLFDRPTRAEGSISFVPQPAPVQTLSWQSPFSIPAKVTAARQVIEGWAVYPAVEPPPPAATPDIWWQSAFSEPVRRKVHPITHEYEGYFAYPYYTTIFTDITRRIGHPGGRHRTGYPTRDRINEVGARPNVGDAKSV